MGRTSLFHKEAARYAEPLVFLLAILIAGLLFMSHRMTGCHTAVEKAAEYMATETELFAAMDACMRRGVCDRGDATALESRIEQLQTEFFAARKACGL